jgi:cytochrome P450
MKATKVPAGPRGQFLVGNAFQVLRDPFGFLGRMVRDYGDVVLLRFGSVVTYVLNHPRDIEYVLRTNHRNFIKDRGTRMLTSLVGEGLLTSEGEVWRRQRRLAQPAFQFEQVQKYTAAMVAAGERLAEDWRPGQVRDVHEDMMRLTLEIVAETLFGANVAGVSERVGRAMEVVMRHFASPLIWFDWLQKLPTPGNLRFRRAVRQLDDVVYGLIRQRRTEGRDAGDLLSRLLEAQDEAGNRMTDRQLRDELITLFLAGHETTALALSYTFHLLARHPDVEARLAAELDEVLTGRSPTAADLPQLRYTDWVVRESMRLYPPAYSIGREAVGDCEIGGYPVPKGTQISLIQWVVHRDSRWFPDPEAFRPERWDNDLARRLPRCAYFPFGDGPRVCIGSQFAMTEAVLVLATLARRFRLALVPGHEELRFLLSVTLRPKHGVVMRVEERGTPQGGRHPEGVSHARQPA